MKIATMLVAFFTFVLVAGRPTPSTETAAPTETKPTWSLSNLADKVRSSFYKFIPGELMHYPTPPPGYVPNVIPHPTMDQVKWHISHVQTEASRSNPDKANYWDNLVAGGLGRLGKKDGFAEVHSHDGDPRWGYAKVKFDSRWKGFEEAKIYRDRTVLVRPTPLDIRGRVGLVRHWFREKIKGPQPGLGVEPGLIFGRHRD